MADGVAGVGMNLPFPEAVERARHVTHGGERGAPHGAFRFTFRGAVLLVIASGEGGWDHVSVSCAKRCPEWDEMEFIKRLFFREDECAMQLHPPLSQYVNVHPHVLHLWRPHAQPIPQPPMAFV